MYVIKIAKIIFFILLIPPKDDYFPLKHNQA